MKLQKETNEATGTAHGRWYHDACGAAFALELIGERWSLLVIRELMLGGRRFSDLRAHLPGISAKVLTQRLEGLESVGVLTRRKLPPPAATQIYELTDWGYEAEPILQELGRWAARSSLHDPRLPLSPMSLMMSLRTMFDPDQAGELVLGVGFDVAGELFHAQVERRTLVIRRTEVLDAAVSFIAPDASALAGLIYGLMPVDAAADNGITIQGEATDVRRFLDLFELPAKSG
ncbi:helix-turn-helix domain-containing protein [uncultured Abyssibacter sp.]|uniref:winged helix-turn-helix transcriptional regulator n=1 Tax=uncultured Abyssibacter sp. TaxID=2320202 RepID=UPI0032B2EFEA